MGPVPCPCPPRTMAPFFPSFVFSYLSYSNLFLSILTYSYLFLSAASYGCQKVAGRLSAGCRLVDSGRTGGRRFRAQSVVDANRTAYRSMAGSYTLQQAAPHHS